MPERGSSGNPSTWMPILHSPRPSRAVRLTRCIKPPRARAKLGLRGCERAGDLHGLVWRQAAFRANTPSAYSRIGWLQIAPSAGVILKSPTNSSFSSQSGRARLRDPFGPAEIGSGFFMLPAVLKTYHSNLKNKNRNGVRSCFCWGGPRLGLERPVVVDLELAGAGFPDPRSGPPENPRRTNQPTPTKPDQPA